MTTTSSILRRRSMLLSAAMIACATTALPLTATAADMAAFSATLTGSAEVPPNNSPASGTLDATLDKGTRELSWKATYIGLTGPATMAHFHGPAMPGENAGVAVPFKTAVSPIEGKATLTPEQVNDLLAGKWYANVHTAQHPGGEIRGQLMLKQ